MQHHSVGYVFRFSLAVCGVCAIFVAASAVVLADRQEANEALGKKRNVLEAAGLVQTGEAIDAAEIEKRFARIRPAVIDLATGDDVSDQVDPATYDQQAAKKDPQASHEPPPNPSRISRLPDRALIYQVRDDAGELEMVILPIEGYGLWGTLYGFVAVGADGNTIRGITYYRHKETPGLGGEVDNPSWKALWPGRKIYGEGDTPRISVVKGHVGPPAEAPYSVDGLSGATLTSRGVSNMLHFWFGGEGFGPYLEKLRRTS